MAERALRYQGLSVSGGSPNPNQYTVQEDSSTADMVNALTSIAGVAAEQYLETAKKKANADKIIQTDLAHKGQPASDDATKAGYLAHAAVTLQSRLAKSKIELKALADQNPSEEEWQAALSDSYTNTELEVTDAYQKHGVKDAKLVQDLDKLTSLGMSEIVPELRAYREVKKVEADEKDRINATVDSIVSGQRANPSKSAEVIVKEAEAAMNAQKISPYDREGIFEDAVIVSGSLSMVEAAKQFKNGRSTSVYDRSPSIQKMERQLLTVEKVKNEVEKGKFKVDLEGLLFNGEIDVEGFNAGVKLGEDQFGKDEIYSADQYKSVIQSYEKEQYKVGVVKARASSILAGQFVDASPEEKSAAYEQIYNDLMTAPDPSMQGLEGEELAAAQQRKVGQVNSQMADLSTAQNVPFEPFIASMRSFANLNVATVEKEEPNGVGVMTASLGQKAEQAMSIYNSMSAPTKEWYLSKMTGPEASIMKNMAVFLAADKGPVRALKMAQREQIAPSIPRKQEDITASASSIIGELGWGSGDVSGKQKGLLMATGVNILRGFADPTSDVAKQHLKDYFSKGYSEVAGGIRVAGNKDWWNVNAHLSNDPAIMANAFNATIEANIASLGPNMENMGLSASDLVPEVNKETGMLQFYSEDGIPVGKVIPVREMAKNLAKAKVSIESKYVEYQLRMNSLSGEDAAKEIKKGFAFLSLAKQKAAEEYPEVEVTDAQKQDATLLFLKQTGVYKPEESKL